MGLNLKKQINYPARPGARVRLIQMDDPYTKLKEGDEGTITNIDDAGVIHVNWDAGSTLGLVPEADRFTVLNEEDNKYRPFPKGEDRNQEIGDRNQRLYQQAEESMISEEGSEDSEDNDDEEVEEYDPYEGKERRFRISFYVDVHVQMTANLEHDRQIAEQAGSEILKKLNQKDVSNAYMGGVAHNPFASIPDDKEFSRL
jgi:hypothetical protein